MKGSRGRKEITTQESNQKRVIKINKREKSSGEERRGEVRWGEEI